MVIGIQYYLSDNTIFDFYKDIKSIATSRMDFDGGYVEGYSEDVLGVFVVDNLILIETPRTDEHGHVSYCKHLEDTQGNVYKYGDEIPSGLIDLSEQFRKKTYDDLLKENEELKISLADLWEVVLLGGGV